jgi:hypothetical protein
VAVVDARPLAQHVFALGGLGVLLLVRTVILVNVGADVCEEVGAVAGLADGVADADEVAAVLRVLLAEEGEVVLFQR